MAWLGEPSVSCRTPTGTSIKGVNELDSGTGCISAYSSTAEMIFMTSSGLDASREFVPVAMISTNLEQLQFFQMASLLSNR